MFPFLRMGKDWFVARRMPALGLFDTHVSTHRCWPVDLDFWGELNNGRALTLYDLGRTGLAERIGLIRTLTRTRWALTMAGSSVRYRHRIRPFERFEMRSRLVCWDDKFFYLEQSMWKTNGTCASHVLYRSAVTDRNGIVTPSRVGEAMGVSDQSPPMPDWIAAWCRAESTRPWPPMTDGVAVAA